MLLICVKKTSHTREALECRVTAEVPGATHSIFLAEVHSALANEGMPLTSFRGKMGRFAFMSTDAGTALWQEMRWDYAA